MIEALQKIGFTNALSTSAGITLVLCVIAIIGSRRIETIPNSKIQNALEAGIEKLYHFFEDIMGEYACKRYFPLVATLFIYILVCNYSGLLPMSGHLPGLAAPTSSFNFPLGLAVVVFLFTQYVGIRESHGVKFFKHLFRPFAFLFPIMLIEQFVRPLSLTLRLYGNVFGEEKVIESFFEMVPLGLPIPLQALSILMGFVQAMVFSLLAAIYIGEAVEEAHSL